MILKRVLLDNREIKIWTLRWITNTTITVQFNPSNGMCSSTGWKRNTAVYTHGSDSTRTPYVCVCVCVYWPTQKTSRRGCILTRRDPPPPAESSLPQLTVSTHCYYTFGVPSPDNADNDNNNSNNNNNNNNTKLLSFGAIDCVVTVV
jgi:hypothetical protein